MLCLTDSNILQCRPWLGAFGLIRQITDPDRLTDAVEVDNTSSYSNTIRSRVYLLHYELCHQICKTDPGVSLSMSSVCKC